MSKPEKTMHYTGKSFSLKSYNLKTQFASPWSNKQRIRMLCWEYAWIIMCGWTPKPFNRWRLMWLRFFGAKIYGKPFVHQRARIAMPWNVTLHDHACLGDGAHAYSLGEIEIMPNATVAQEAYLCTGTHDFTVPTKPLQTGNILVGKASFIGARAFIMPGISIGKNAVVAACSVVTRDVPGDTVVAGNPARVIKQDH